MVPLYRESGLDRMVPLYKESGLDRMVPLYKESVHFLFCFVFFCFNCW